MIESREPARKGVVRAMWQIQQDGCSLLLVAWLDGEPVGSGQLDVRTAPPELKNLNVDAERRGEGIGSAILRAAEDRLGTGARLGVGADNPRARALHERLGYQGTGKFSRTSCEYVDDEGVGREATETGELLVKVLP